MPYYMMSVYSDEETRNRSEEELAPLYEAVGKVNEEAMNAGIFVFAGGLDELPATTTIDGRAGTALVTDGPYVETKDYIGGLSILDVPDHATALAWAEKAAVACRGRAEVRPFLAGFAGTASEHLEG